MPAKSVVSGGRVVADFDLPEKRVTVFDLDAVLGKCKPPASSVNFHTDDPDADEHETAQAHRLLDLLTKRRASAEETLAALGLSLDGMVIALYTHTRRCACAGVHATGEVHWLRDCFGGRVGDGDHHTRGGFRAQKNAVQLLGACGKQGQVGAEHGLSVCVYFSSFALCTLVIMAL
jgi:hypothetical protein